MNNPLPAPSLHPATQHLLLSVAAIGTGVLLPTLLSEAMTGAALLAGAAGAVGGLGQNLFSGIIQRLFTRRENDPTRPDLNRDLEVRLLGDAIVEELTKFSATLAPAAQSKCRAFAGKIAPAFDELMRGNELPDLTPPDFMHLLAAAAQEQEIPPVGTVNEWLQIVGRLHSKCNGDLHIDTLKEIAVWLHRHLWTSIHSRLKSDFATDGRAYAALQLSFMGTVLHGIDHLTKEAQLTNAQLTELRAIKEQQADPKAALLATLAQDNAALATQFTFYFMQLNGHLDEQFG
ncbi:MAG: hypothetical protein HOP18_06835, partial [Deltaproteobacteria bacterium]|nr:hypothetical protein [Deltaproteobacteria bacterium]